MNQEQHEMVLEKTYPSGLDEWYCPTCGRRMLLHYGPKFKKTILEAGDEYAVHSGGKGGLRTGSMQVASVDPTVSENDRMISLNDPSLAPWIAWLDEVGFENLWDDEA
jgi:hypothetical protein